MGPMLYRVGTRVKGRGSAPRAKATGGQMSPKGAGWRFTTGAVLLEPRVQEGGSL
jgi:hypothetical protein